MIEKESRAGVDTGFWQGGILSRRHDGKHLMLGRIGRANYLANSFLFHNQHASDEGTRARQPH